MGRALHWACSPLHTVSRPCQLGGLTTEMSQGKEFRVGPRYTSVKFLGEGAYGVVVQVVSVVVVVVPI